MILAVNIGNSNIRFGIGSDHHEIQSWTISTQPFKTTDEFFVIFKNMYRQYGFEIEDVKDIVIGSVVPHQTRVVAHALEKIHQIKAVIVDRNTPSGVTHESNQMGTDLYANAVAAHSLYQGNKLVIDFGTALTITGIDPNGKVMGVVIAPGVITSLKALVGDTAQLPDIELTTPKNILGKDTESCMQSGMIYGYLGMVEGLIERVNKELESDCFVVSTGGLGHIYKPLTSQIHVDDKLHTLRGLMLLYAQCKNH